MVNDRWNWQIGLVAIPDDTYDISSRFPRGLTMPDDKKTLTLYQCENGHHWEAEKDDPCPACGEPAKTIKEITEDKTTREKIASGESGMSSDPNPHPRDNDGDDYPDDAEDDER